MKVFTLTIILLLTSTTLFAASIHGRIILEHESVEYVGTFDFDSSQIRNDFPVVRADRLTFSNFSLNFLGHQITNENFGIGLQYTRTFTSTNTTCCAEVDGAGWIHGLGTLYLFPGHFDTALYSTGDLSGEQWVLEPTFGRNAIGGSIRTEIGAAAVPEPSTVLMMGSGLVGLIGWRWRRGQIN